MDTQITETGEETDVAELGKLVEFDDSPPTVRTCDLLLFVATRTELLQLLEVAVDFGFGGARRKIPRRAGRATTYYDLGLVGLRHVMVVKTAIGPFTHGGSASRAIHCLIETQAQGLIAVGMAFGTLPRDQQLGQILIATGILPYDSCIVRSGQTTSSQHEYKKVRSHKASESLLAEFRRAIPSSQIKVHLGLMLSGGATIQCESFRELLARRCGHGKGEPVVGGDMESVGLLSACEPDRPNWLIVKAISDFADHDRDAVINKGRPLACRNAAAFVLTTLAARDFTS